ncbi:unnamed protein product [Adineta ricciae]|uniref:Ion transport domain-containing protein n=1 Tax=Adineta ricciae TaxID=249248 RepID=A0A815L4N3_ADIRI|nr:unnamed protein product [Adineta ricciae]CAF1401752.1 unnamed protein product [Adineta ricciae]
MQVESEIFLPSKLDHNRQKPYQHRHHHAPKFSLFLYRLFEQTPIYAYVLFFVFTFATYVGTLTTYDEHRTASVPVLFYIELSIFVYCLIEFILRIYASNAKERYCGMQGKRRFFLEHYLIFDFLLLVCYGIVFLWNFAKFYHSHALFLHALRFLQLFRFIPLDRYIGSIPLIWKIVRQYRRVLLATVYMCFLLMLPTAYLLWIVERSIKTNDLYFFQTYTDSLWFTINSMATIGYGDTWPQTLIGRLLTATLCCIGVVLWTLPAGIISAGLTSVDEKRHARKQLYGPAARFILAWWRLQHVNKRIRSIRSKDNQKERCKQVIAYLHCARLCREFQHHRYGTPQDYDIQLRRDINQILHQLQIIGNKLNNTSENLHIEQ